LDLVEVPAENI